MSNSSPPSSVCRTDSVMADMSAEILEVIFLWCDGDTLLRCRCVCRRWKSLVDRLIGGIHRQLSVCVRREMSPVLVRRLGNALGPNPSLDCVYRAWRRHKLLANWPVSTCTHTDVLLSLRTPVAVSSVDSQTFLVMYARRTLLILLEHHTAALELPVRVGPTQVTHLALSMLPKLDREGNCIDSGVASFERCFSSGSGQSIRHYLLVFACGCHLTALLLCIKQLLSSAVPEIRCYPPLQLTALPSNVVTLWADDNNVCAIDSCAVYLYRLEVCSIKEAHTPSLYSQPVVLIALSGNSVVWPISVLSDRVVSVSLASDYSVTWFDLSCSSTRDVLGARKCVLRQRPADLADLEPCHVLDRCEFDGVAVVSLGCQLFVAVADDYGDCVLLDCFELLECRVTSCCLHANLLALGTEAGAVLVYHVPEKRLFTHSPSAWTIVSAVNLQPPSAVIKLHFVEKARGVGLVAVLEESIHYLDWRPS